MKGAHARILPTRNGNLGFFRRQRHMSKSTDPTYKEWKLFQKGSLGVGVRSTDPTYKEWKLGNGVSFFGGVCRTDPTYKEWKPCGVPVYVFGVC